MLLSFRSKILTCCVNQKSGADHSVSAITTNTRASNFVTTTLVLRAHCALIMVFSFVAVTALIPGQVIAAQNGTATRKGLDVPVLTIVSPFVDPGRQGRALRIEPSPDGRWLCVWADENDGSRPTNRPSCGSSHGTVLWATPTSRVHWTRIGFGTLHGSWRRDSRAYAYCAGSYDGHPSLKVLQLPTFRQENIPLAVGYCDDPSFAPSGDRIAVMTGQLGDPRPFCVNLPENPDTNYDPVHKVYCYSHIVIYNSRTKGSKAYKIGDLNLPTPLQWSSDSSRILFCPRGFGLSGWPLHTLEVKSGKEAEFLTKNDGEFDNSFFIIDSWAIYTDSVDASVVATPDDATGAATTLLSGGTTLEWAQSLTRSRFLLCGLGYSGMGRY